jgi:hypothetical protein
MSSARVAEMMNPILGGRGQAAFCRLHYKLLQASTHRRLVGGLLAVRKRRACKFDLNDERGYSLITRSAHSTRDTKMAGLPNFAPH